MLIDAKTIILGFCSFFCPVVVLGLVLVGKRSLILSKMQQKHKLWIVIASTVVLAIVVIVIIAVLGSSDKLSPKLYISQGIIQGKVFWSRNGREFNGYLAIPYADKPRRFQAPVEAATMWEGIRDATKYGPACPQMEHGRFIGDEDCLFVNVFTPNLNGSMPVLFYIYGGGFLEGHAQKYKPDFLLDEDVVLVTFNYRVGAFGFLCTDDGEVQGNMGLKDQATALRWVQKNIASFGGDKNRVTILGSSAGAASVSYQVLSPMSKMLFKNAIMQAGSALNPWAINLKPSSLTQKLALQIGCTTTRSMRELVQCIRQKPAATIAKQTFIKWHYDPHITYAPCIERSSGSEVFLPDYPYKLLKDGRFNRVNVILGIAKDEGLLFHAATVLRNATLLNQLNTQFARIAPITLVYDEDPAIYPSKWPEIGPKIRNFYFPNNVDIDNHTRQSLIDMYSDRWFIHGIQEEALNLARYVNVYPYILSFTGQSSVLEQAYGIKQVLGVAHGDDIQYFFDGAYSRPLTSWKDIEFSKNIIKLWTSFADNGFPTDIWSPPNQVWPKITQEDIKTREIRWLELDEETKIIRAPFRSRMNFWNHLLTFERP